MLSSDQIRGARAILRLSQAELAKAASVSLETIKRLEAMHGELKVRLDTLTRIKDALERAGVIYLRKWWRSGSAAREAWQTLEVDADVPASR